MPRKPAHAAASGHTAVYLLLLILTVASFCAWVLSLPLFPTVDGPMHLYFTHVLQSVLTDPHSFYGRFYYVRHVLPPYALYYYALMVLSRFVPVLLADKLIICLYFISFAFGFRYLARAVGPSGDIMSLLATTLLLNWPLGMGFVNFCLSTSFALWALGLWCRAAARDDDARKIGFVLLAYLVMLTHPVPLLAVLCFCVVELGVRLFYFRSQSRAFASTFFPRLWLKDAVYVAAAMVSLLYVKLFTVSNMLHQVHVIKESPWRREYWLLRSYLLLHTLMTFIGKTFLDLIYRSIFYGLLVGALWLAVRQFRRSRKSNSKVDPQQTIIVQCWTLVSIGLLLIFPFIPSDLNNSAFFSARLLIFIWIAALLAAAGATIRSPSVRTALAALAVFSTVVTLWLAHQRINPVAKQVAFIETMPPVPRHSLGVYLYDPSYRMPKLLTYDPFGWNGVRMFRRTDSLLYNTPWLDLPIIPLGPRGFMPTGSISSLALEFPPTLRTLLENEPEERELVLSHVNFALVNFGESTPVSAKDALLVSGAGQSNSSPRPWTCQTGANISICKP